ncbi:MAG: hypothetical protein EXR81_05005 [Gammaproteobacteria bacterium]|nr:hypothetical protein [Gammaproteobacteria bacterium]
MNKIQLFDVDGTLTYNAVDKPQAQTIYPTYGYWPLLSSQLCKNKNRFRKAVTRWEKSMRTETDPDASSFKIMALVVQEHLRNEIGAEQLRQTARDITRNFIKYDIVQLAALEYINRCLEKNIYCVLTTGSYLDGLRGMVDVLQEQHLLLKSDYLLLNGAEINWAARELLHANIGHYKVDKLFQTIKDKKITPYTITAAFGDDPYINDKAILEQAPTGCAFVIKSKKNVARKFSEDFVSITWEQFLLSVV